MDLFCFSRISCIFSYLCMKYHEISSCFLFIDLLGLLKGVLDPEEAAASWTALGEDGNLLVEFNAEKAESMNSLRCCLIWHFFPWHLSIPRQVWKASSLSDQVFQSFELPGFLSKMHFVEFVVENPSSHGHFIKATIYPPK